MKSINISTTGNKGSIDDIDASPMDDKEREYYEKAHIDFLRMTYPTTALFVEHVRVEWNRRNYQVRDYLSALPRDALYCLLNNLELVDICRLAMTCRSLRSIVNDAKYDDYWRVRVYKTPNFLFVSNNGKYETSQGGRLKVVQSIRWFDVFQWTIIRDRDSLHIKQYQNMLQNRRTFNSWLHRKHGKKILPAKATFSIFFQGWKWKPARDGSGRSEHIITFHDDFYEYLWEHGPIQIPANIATLVGLKQTVHLKVYYQYMFKYIFETFVPPIMTKNSRNGCLLTLPDEFLANYSLVPIVKCQRCKHFNLHNHQQNCSLQHKWWYHHCVFYTILTPSIISQLKEFLSNSGMVADFDSSLLIENIPRLVRNKI